MLTMLETKERNWRNETEERNKNGESYFIVKPGICPVARNRASPQLANSGRNPQAKYPKFIRLWYHKENENWLFQLPKECFLVLY